MNPNPPQADPVGVIPQDLMQSQVFGINLSS